MTDPTDQRPLRMLRVVRRVAAHVTYGVATLPERARTWFAVRVRRRDEALEVVASTDRWSPHVAVVAVFPRRALATSVQRLLAGLREVGSTIVLVVNESADAEWCEQQWRSTADVVLRRPNIGRDFGAYRAAVRFLVDRAPVGRIQRLSLFNDSVVYPQSPTAALEWLTRVDGCAALTVHARPRPHLQSYAFSLPGSVAFGPALSEFWHRYYPTDVRHRVVRQGEVGLSDVLRGEGWLLQGLASAERLEAALGSAEGEWFAALADSERRSIAWAVALDPYGTSVATEVGGGGEVRGAPAFESMNPTHAFGLAATRLLGLPLKVDLVRVGAATLDDVRDVLAAVGTPADEGVELLALFAPHRAPHRLARMWQGAGLW